MTLLLAGLFILTAVTGLFVVLSRDPKRQVFAFIANGTVLSVLFLALQAPDVGLSEIVVGAVALPLFFLVALAAVALNKAGR